MREKIYALAKGNFTYEAPKPVTEPEKLSAEVVSGTVQTVTLTVSNEKGTKIKGFGFTEAQEIVFLPVFEGEENILECEINATNLIAGDALRGKLILVTDCGELRVPYEFRIVAPVLKDAEGGEVRDYFTLQKRAEDDPREGLALFRDPIFRETFLYRDPEGQLIYDRLRSANTGLSGMEEFLVAYDKKQSVRFVPDHRGTMPGDTIVYELSGSDIDDAIDIKLNTWGSIAIRVSVEGDFIDVDKKLLWTDEFIDCTGRLEYRIVSGRVGSGKHYGRIVFSGPYETHSVDIEVHSPVGSKERKIARAKQAVEAMLIRSYLAYEEKRVDREEFAAFLKKHRSVIERLPVRYAEPLRGYIAWILDDEEAKLRFYRETENPEPPAVDAGADVVENYVLSSFVKYMFSGREEDLVLLRGLIDVYMENGHMSTEMLLVRLRCGIPYDEAGAKAVESIRGQLIGGESSALLYSALIRLYREHPELLLELDAVNLRTLLYGLKADLISDELIETINILAEGRGLPPIDTAPGMGFLRENDSLSYGTGALLMQVLFGVWEKSKSIDTLKCICTLLIRHEKRDKRYHIWYERGVKEMLRLTDLFEYYIYTADPTDRKPLDNVVLSYFQYENHLGDTRKAYLYANILANRQSNASAYETYEPQIREFVLRQIERERVTSDLGYLYSQVLDVGAVMELKEHLPHIMFRYMLSCDVCGIESVTVVTLQTNTDKIYPLDHGKALLEIFSPDYRLFFTDRDGNQYSGSIEYTLERFFDGDEYALICYPEPETEDPVDEEISDDTDQDTKEENRNSTEKQRKPKVSESLLFHIAIKAEKKARLDDREMDALARALETGKLKPYFKGRVFLRLYDHIVSRVPEEKRDDELKALMKYADATSIKRSRIGEIATECIRLGEYEKAYEMLSTYGKSGCGEDELCVLTTNRIDEIGDDFSDTLVKWALWLYKRGKREHSILNYLLKYYMGETDTLVAIFRDALPKQEEGTGLEKIQAFEGHIKSDPAFYESVRERVLGQMLFAGRNVRSTEDIFLDYFEDGDNRVLVKAYLSQIAYDYIIGRGELSDKCFEKIYHQALYDKESCMVLAALKKLSGKKSYDEKETGFIERSLEEYASEGRVLPFMKEFSGDMVVPYEVRTPVIVQYYSGTDRGVFLFVKKNGAYESQPMRKVFDGIFVASLLLFTGEETKGYIYEEETGKRSKEFVLRKKEAIVGEESLFEQVNAMIEAKESDDDEEYEKLRRAYLTERGVAEKLFTLL